MELTHKERILTIVWLALMLVTLTSVFTSSHAALPAARWALLGLCYAKCRLVFLHFMELNEAPRAWRLFFEAWIASVVLMLGFLITAA